MDLKLAHYIRDDVEIIDAAGEIDVHTSPRLRELITDLVNAGVYHIVVDMRKVEFLDSTGLGVLVGGLKRVRAHDGSLSIICTQERILKIFRITGLTKVFSISSNPQEAIAKAVKARSRTADGSVPESPISRYESITNRDRPEFPATKPRTGGQREIPIQIYLENAEPAHAVEDAIRTLLGELGIAVIEDTPPITGSWFKRLSGQLKRAADSDTAAKAQRALEMQVLDRFQAGIDGVTGDAVAKLITALEHTSGAVIQVGSVLLVKANGTVIVRQLSQVEMLYWQRNPGLFKDPATALAELQRAAQADSETQHPATHLPLADRQ